ncbi:hypothetical protein [Thiorhodovibrio winogradskyi]|uniref:hypothetical protein n=1 Tax=Thiorhodovibrio winogradskyi TaxID=77007 RepID=UPI002E27E22A|nr:hypothetical protein [Thiorhodovibrio winogradskyi]
MLAILHFFIDLCLLRRAPQDLPASSVIFALVVVAGTLGSMLLALSAGEKALVGFLQGLLDIAFMAALLHVILRLVDKPARFLQTATALIGADTLIGLVALLPLSLAAGADETSGLLVLAGFLFMGLVVWGVLASAHILRHAFEIPLMQGVFLAIAYDVLAFFVIGGLTQGLS